MGGAPAPSLGSAGDLGQPGQESREFTRGRGRSAANHATRDGPLARVLGEGEDGVKRESNTT